ncbi:MAG: response regulator [Aggregatilineales bacterium]
MKTILIIEDDSLNLELFKNFLEMLGYDVASAATATDGIELARELTPVLILIDYRLRGDMDGIEAARIIKKDPNLVHVPLIIITAHERPGDKDRAFAIGCEGYMVKPIRMGELKQVILELT